MVVAHGIPPVGGHQLAPSLYGEFHTPNPSLLFHFLLTGLQLLLFSYLQVPCLCLVSASSYGLDRLLVVHRPNFLRDMDLHHDVHSEVAFCQSSS